MQALPGRIIEYEVHGLHNRSSFKKTDHIESFDDADQPKPLANVPYMFERAKIVAKANAAREERSEEDLEQQRRLMGLSTSARNSLDTTQDSS